MTPPQPDPLRPMCLCLKDSTSSFHAWILRPPSRRALQGSRLLERIREHHEDQRWRDGNTAHGRGTRLRRRICQPEPECPMDQAPEDDRQDRLRARNETESTAGIELVRIDARCRRGGHRPDDLNPIDLHCCRAEGPFPRPLPPVNFQRAGLVHFQRAATPSRPESAPSWSSCPCLRNRHRRR